MKHFTSKIVLVNLIFIICFLIFASCSFIGQSKHWSPEMKDNTRWVSSSLCFAPYLFSDVKSARFEYRDISISVCPQLKGGSALTFGPPGLPIIPNLIALFSPGGSEQFTISIKIESKEHKTSIDLSKIRVEFSESTTLLPLTVKVHRGGDKKEFELSTINKFLVENEIVEYVLTFDIKKRTVGEIVIHIGAIDIDGESVLLPPLMYKNDPSLHYIPIVLGS